MNKIDTHQHLIYPDQLTYPWLGSVPALQADRFQLRDYQRAAVGLGIIGSVFMEVDVAEGDAVSEAHYICELAEKEGSGILGVIGSGRPESEGFREQVELMEHRKLKGIRRVLHVVPDETSQSTRFRDNVNWLASRGMSFDLCLKSTQLAIGESLVKSAQDTQFILDHLGNPDLVSGEIGAWRQSVERLSKLENVVCKISGMLTQCPVGEISIDRLRPAVEWVIECFGWERVLWGGDWPVCDLNGNLRHWVDSLDEILSEETEENLVKLYEANARRIYRLDE